MSQQQIRRFSRFQIALHWAVGLPYLALLASGALILLRRSGLIEWPGSQAVETLHRWVGIGLIAVLAQMLFAALVSGQLLALLKDFSDWALLRPRDFAWLAKLPLNVFWPSRFHLPPAGRFNAGQKLHGLFILIALTTFSITGILMILRPAELRPWVIHSWLFFGAAAFLALHLFLGLINPLTRRALSGIFTGHVSRDYVLDHHPLVLGQPVQPPHPHAVVSWKALAGTWAIALLLAATLAGWYGPQRLLERVSHLRNQEHPTISPGPLLAAHADDPRLSGCQTCHDSMHQPSDAACLSCHTEIQTVMQQRVGYHGQLQGNCRDCHADHKGREADLRPLDSRTFNHQLARFVLKGKHQDLACDKCHVEHASKPGQRQFVSLAFAACTNCHANPHDQRASLDCARCHTERGFGGRVLTFNHQRDASFHLDGKHAQVACEQCHQPDRPAPAPLASAAPARPVALRAILPIARQQTGLAPARHPFQLNDIGAQCADCHVDPHRPALGADCQRCHTSAGWTGQDLLFRHDRDTHFRLEEAHASVQCQQCHKLPRESAALAEAAFKKTSTTCADCHDDPHRAQLGDQCGQCHLPTRWTGRQLLFEHNRDSTFALKGQHLALACEKCHKPASPTAKLAQAQFKGLSSQCRQCHEDPHQKQFDKSCAACHSEQGWKGRQLLFEHNRDSRFKLDAIHDALACAACHERREKTMHFRPQPTTCEQCHAPVAQAMAGRIAGATMPADPHSTRVRCIDCHAPAVRSPTPTQYADACQQCHGPRYRTVYFDWQRSLDDRSARLREKIKRIEAVNPDQTKALAEQLDQARRVGFHNLQQAVPWLDRLNRTALDLEPR